jgi:hypothetical protein
MQCRAGICRQSDDIAGIGRDLWCEQDNMKHQTAATRDYGKDGLAYAVSGRSARSSRPRCHIAFATDHSCRDDPYI